MSVNNTVLFELALYARRVLPKDEESLARFHKECIPERILEVVEEIERLRTKYTSNSYDVLELKRQTEDLEDEVSELQDRIDELEGTIMFLRSSKAQENKGSEIQNG